MLPAFKTVQKPDLQIESQVGYPNCMLAGVDEVGRGCIAGPVVAAAAVLPSHIDYVANPWLLDVTDSKKLTEAKREELYPLIQKWVPYFCIAQASVEEIDRINIFHASHLAMIRAMKGLKKKADIYLVDGKFLPLANEFKMRAVIKGDLKCLSIACASILAKVYRDQIFIELDKKHPDFGFASHKGYPTPLHKKILKDKKVPFDLYRKSFAPVKEALGLQSEINPNEQRQTELFFS